MEASLTPLEAYVAAQSRQPWFASRWTPSMFGWLDSVAQKPSQKDNLFNTIAELYLEALRTPGSDYRLAWLPDYRDLLYHWSEDKVNPDLPATAKILSTPEWSSRLDRFSPYSAEQIAEEVNFYWDSQRVRVGALLGNPNASPEWLTEKWKETQTLYEEGRLGEAEASRFMRSIASNPSISDELVHSMLRYSKTGLPDGLYYLPWNPAFTEEHAEEYFSGGFGDPRRPEQMMWHGTVSTVRKFSYIPKPASSKPVFPFSKDFETELRNVYAARTEITGWLAGVSNPLRYTREDLIRTKDLNDFLMSPWMSQSHIRELERTTYEAEYGTVRLQIAEAVIAMYSDSPTTNRDYDLLVKALNFIADHFRRLDELSEEVGGEHVPTEWLLELL